MYFFFNESNSETLISFIKRKVGETIASGTEKSGWILYIMTYSITQEGLNDLFENLKENLGKDITQVRILADKKEWAKLCFYDKENVLQNLIRILKPNTLNKENIFIDPVDNKHLFHAKSYALIHPCEIVKAFEGFVIVTSGNLSRNGLKLNTEFASFSIDPIENKKYITLFNSQNLLEELQLKSLEQIAKAELIFREGVFYKKGDGLEESGYSIKLDKKAGIIRRNSKSTDTGSNLYRLVDLSSVKRYLPALIPDTVITNYTIETLIGRWVPNPIHKLIEERKRLYKQAYIDFIKDRYNENTSYFKYEKSILEIEINIDIPNLVDIDNEIFPETNNLSKEEKHKNFIESIYEKCLDRIKPFLEEDKSISSIFFDHYQIEAIKFQEIPNELKTEILDQVIRSLKDNTNKILGKTIQNLSFRSEISSIEYLTKLEQHKQVLSDGTKISMRKEIKNLKKGDFFSALIRIHDKPNMNESTYKINSGCLFYKNQSESISYYFANTKLNRIKKRYSRNHIKFIHRDSIILFKKLDKEDIRFLLPFLDLKKDFIELKKKFDLKLAEKILSKLSFILSGYERIKLFLIALDLFPKIDDKIEDFVLEIAKRLKIELWYSKEKNAIKIDTKANLNKYLEIRQAFEKNKNRPKAEFVPSYVFRIIPIPINKKIMAKKYLRKKRIRLSCLYS